MKLNSDHDYEVICIGAGPANLSLAAALEDKAPKIAKRTTIFEANSVIEWQPGLMIRGALSQVSFLKDLATLRDPKSRYTFTNYLHETNKLNDFLNMGSGTAYREEISCYHNWVADQLPNVKIRKSSRVLNVEPLKRDGGIMGWAIETEGGGISTCRHVVCGAGRDPYIPEIMRALDTNRIIHSANFTQKICAWTNAAPKQIAIVGSAQSAAEMTLEIGKLFPDAERTLIMRSIGMVGYESSKFTNELFYPDYVDKFNNLKEEDRESVLLQMRRTNYSGLAPATIEALYSDLYLSRLHGDTSFGMKPLTEISAASVTDDDEVVLDLISKYDGQSTEKFDLVLLGTGFESEMPKLVKSLAENVGLSSIDIDRSYKLRTGGAKDKGLCFVQGVNEATHGIADSLLSVQSARTDEISNSIIQSQVSEPTTGAFIKPLNAAGMVHENGLDAQRLLPLPITTPFEASWCVIRPGTSSAAHHHHEYEIFVALEGEAEIEADGVMRKFTKGDTAYFEPGTTHRVINNGCSPFRMYSIWWDRDMCHRQIAAFSESERKVV